MRSLLKLAFWAVGGLGSKTNRRLGSRICIRAGSEV